MWSWLSCKADIVSALVEALDCRFKFLILHQQFIVGARQLLCLVEQYLLYLPPAQQFDFLFIQ